MHAPGAIMFKGKGYLPITLMQFTRGCRFACDFCAVTQYFDHKHYLRAIDETSRRSADCRPRLLFFVDDNIASNHEALKELCRALIPMRIHWVSQASLDITRDPKLMQLMVDAGCLGHVIGFESITRESMQGDEEGAEHAASSTSTRAVRILRDYGLQTWAAFTLGYDHDTRRVHRATLDFALENRFSFAAFNILMPYPEHAALRRLEREGRHLYDGKWWLHPEYRFNDAAFVPARMTPDELTAACHAARVRYNRSVADVAVLRREDQHAIVRAHRRPTGLQPIFRKEVYKKHGMRFGLH